MKAALFCAPLIVLCPAAASAFCTPGFIRDGYTGQCVAASRYGETAGSSTYHGTPQDDPNGLIYNGNQIKEPQFYSDPLAAPRCHSDPQVINGAITWVEVCN